MPEMPDSFIPEVLASDDEAAIRPSRRPPTPLPDMDISAPILNPNPLPVLLQPVVYDPSAKTGPLVGNQPSAAALAPLTKTPSNRSLGSSTSASAASQPSSAAAARAAELAGRISAGVADDDDNDNNGLSAVQRRIEAELLEAEEAAERSSALRRAKETVLAKLSREFCKRRAGGGGGGAGTSKESAAVMGLPGLNLGTGIGAGGGCVVGGGGGGFGSRWGSGLRDGLFGRSVANVGPIQSDHRSMESQTALVPLIFSRS